MEFKHGFFPQKQFDDYKKQLHSKIHWLLIYKDPSFSPRYDYIDVNAYIDDLVLFLSGLNELLCYSYAVIMILTSLESMKILLQQENFNFYKFRKLVLDTHRLVDDI